MTEVKQEPAQASDGQAKTTEPAKTIDTLVSDIYRVLEEGNVKIDASKLADALANILERENTKPTLRMSNLGTPCERQLWYKINVPDKAEPLKGNVLLKFLIGHVMEEVVLSLAEAAGHKVEHRQATVETCGVEGHIDAVIDGTLTDVKSASTFSFDKFRRGLDDSSDSFGYLGQLGSYRHSAREAGLVSPDGGAGFLAADKQHGTLHFDPHPDIGDGTNWEEFVNHKKAVVSAPEPPPRGFHPVPDGKSGNLKLGVECSYCQFKRECFPGVRTFFYSKGPVHLTHVERVPDVPEYKYEEKQKDHPKVASGKKLSFGPRKPLSDE